MAKEIVSAQKLRELFHYDPEKGVFTWAVRRSNRVHIGDIAGWHDPKTGYVQIGIGDAIYKAHRLAWLYVHGEWPTNHIDHIDGNPANNCIANLRDVSRFLNMQNRRKPSKNNQSGLAGAWRNHDRWFARIMTNGKLHYLGTFDTPEQAHAAYISAKRERHAGCTI